jgi:hypothetical protein
MNPRRKILISILVLYALGMCWGYFRLPWAAIKSLGDYKIVENAPGITFSDIKVSWAQRWYLKHAMKESPTTVTPKVAVSVTWNALVFARVRSGCYLAPLGAEGVDGLYFCLFGLWIRIHTYSHEMA